MPSLLEKIYSLLPNKPQPTSIPTPEQIAAYEAEANEERKKLPWYKYYPAEILEGITSGLLGLDDWTENQERSAGDYTNLLVQAGLPYSAIRGSKPVFRGARKYFETLDPSKYDTGDTLGWMTHFAERPTWANAFSGLDPHITKEVGEKLKASDINPNISAAILPSKNVLDLINPNPDDLSAAIGAVPRPSRNVILRAYRNAVTRKREFPEEVIYENPSRDIIGKLLQELNNPQTFRRTPFDAIRYSDIGDPSWAIPEEVLDEVTTPWGTRLNAGPIRKVYGTPERPRFIATPRTVKEYDPIEELRNLLNKPKGSVPFDVLHKLATHAKKPVKAPSHPNKTWVVWLKGFSTGPEDVKLITKNFDEALDLLSKQRGTISHLPPYLEVSSVNNYLKDFGPIYLPDEWKVYYDKIKNVKYNKSKPFTMSAPPKLDPTKNYVVFDVMGSGYTKVTDNFSSVEKLTNTAKGLDYLTVDEFVSKYGTKGLPKEWQEFYKKSTVAK